MPRESGIAGDDNNSAATSGDHLSSPNYNGIEARSSRYFDDSSAISDGYDESFGEGRHSGEVLCRAGCNRDPASPAVISSPDFSAIPDSDPQTVVNERNRISIRGQRERRPLKI